MGTWGRRGTNLLFSLILEDRREGDAHCLIFFFFPFTTNLGDEYYYSHSMDEQTDIKLLPHCYRDSVQVWSWIQAHRLSIPSLCLLDSRLQSAIMCFKFERVWVCGFLRVQMNSEIPPSPKIPGSSTSFGDKEVVLLGGINHCSSHKFQTHEQVSLVLSLTVCRTHYLSFV